MAIMDTVWQERVVANAASWLDGRHPGWHRKIDVATLSISEPCHCIGGQLLGDDDGYGGFRALLDWLIEDFDGDPIYLHPMTPEGHEHSWAFSCHWAQPYWLLEIERRLLVDQFTPAGDEALAVA